MHSEPNHTLCNSETCAKEESLGVASLRPQLLVMVQKYSNFSIE